MMLGDKVNPKLEFMKTEKWQKNGKKTASSNLSFHHAGIQRNPEKLRNKGIRDHRIQGPGRRPRGGLLGESLSKEQVFPTPFHTGR